MCLPTYLPTYLLTLIILPLRKYVSLCHVIIARAKQSNIDVFVNERLGELWWMFWFKTLKTVKIFSFQVSSSHFYKWVNPSLLLFIFVLFKQTVVFSGIQTEIIGIQGVHADHLTTTTAQFDPSLCLWFEPGVAQVYIPSSRAVWPDIREKRLPK